MQWKTYYNVTSITQVPIQVSYCPSGVCDFKSAEFCKHELGQDHPECKRCDTLHPSPDPPCLKYVPGWSSFQGYQQTGYHGYASIAYTPYHLSAVSGIGSPPRAQNSLARSSLPSSCPPAHCKRPSLANPGKLTFSTFQEYLICLLELFQD